MSRPATVDASAQLHRARERLYVLAQLGGWSFFLLTQLVLIRLFSAGRGAVPGDAYLGLLRLVAIGLLVTHYTRPFLHRWGWKSLGWRSLTPRIFALGLFLAAIWCLAEYLIDFGMLRIERPAKYPLPLLLMMSWLNCSIVMVGWLGIYFFYGLFERLRLLEVEQLRLAASAKDSELRALKSQINPHFLFNSLNSLRALIDEDPPRAREAVTRMANMLRYSLQSGQLETVAVGDELRIVEDYLALEQIRHENRLRVKWDIPDDSSLRALPVPPMLLQTLVENAVKYGIGVRREGGEIGISAWVENRSLRIRVTNPGELSSPNGQSISTGLGLRNASERLKLLFGTQALLQLSADDHTVRADVTIPL